MKIFLLCLLYMSTALSSLPIVAHALPQEPQPTIRYEFYVEFGHPTPRKFYALASPLKNSQIVIPLEASDKVLESGPEGEFSSKSTLKDMAKIKSRITVFLKKTESAKPPKNRRCLDPVKINLRENQDHLRCRELMTKNQKQLLVLLLRYLTEASRKDTKRS